jgi:hypothetical protein
MSTFPAAGPETPVPALPPPQAPRRPKSPGVALLLSVLFPGIGQVYNGQPAKAVFFFAAFVGAIYGAAEVDAMPFAFLIPFVILYNLVDAWRSAALINARAAGGLPEPLEDTAESPAWGAGLVVLGLVLLLNNLGILRLAALRQYWPVLLIAAGGFFLWGSIQRRKETGLGDRP